LTLRAHFLGGRGQPLETAIDDKRIQPPFNDGLVLFGQLSQTTTFPQFITTFYSIGFHFPVNASRTRSLATARA
jgi:hypothetical protein